MKKICLECFTLEELIEALHKVYREASPIKSLPNEDDLLTRMQTQKLLNISLPTLHTWTKLGRLKAHRLSKRIYYKKSEILSALENVNAMKFKKVNTTYA